MHTGAIRGVNLTGWLMLESWVTPNLFVGTGVFDEEQLSHTLGRKLYLELLEEHQHTFIDENDFKQIGARGLNAVRIGVPWYVFGPDSPVKTDQPGSIEILDKAFTWAEAAGIDVLLTLSLIPGAKTATDGLQMVIDPGFEGRKTALEVVGMLADRYQNRPNLLGIEPLAQVKPGTRRRWFMPDSLMLSSLRTYYRDAYKVIREIAGEDPVVVLSDAGLPGSWKKFMAQKRYKNVWLDTHTYHFADQVDSVGPGGARTFIKQTEAQVKAAQTSGLPVMVGEWSAALPIPDAALTPEGRIALERLYTAGQLGAFQDCAAWFFQTWKTDGGLSAWDARLALSSFERDMLD